MNRILSIYRNAYSGLAPSTWWLSLVMLINRSGTMVLPFMTLYLTRNLHFTLGMAGIVMSLFGAGAICGGYIGGKLVDRIGFYPIQLFALVGGGIMFIVLGQMNSYPLICVFTFLLSLINESFRPANSIAIAHYSKEENRTRSYSLNRLAINVGWAVGGTLGGFIAAKNYHLLFWIDGVTNISAAFLLRAVLAPAKNSDTSHKDTAKAVSPRVNSAYRDKPYIVFILLTVLFAYCFFQLFSTMPVYYREHLHLSEIYIGMIMAINGLLIAVFEMVLVFNLEGKRNNLHYITIGVTLTALSFVVFNLFHGALLLAIFSMLICTAGEMLSMPFMNSFWISRSKEANRGQYAGLYTIAWSIAQVAGPGTGAQIAERYGFTMLWWFVGGLCMLGAVLCKWLERSLRAAA